MSAMRIFRQPVQFNFRGLDNMQHEKEKWIQEAFQYIKDIYSLLYTSYTNFGCLFLQTLYFIDGYVIQGGRKLSMNFFLMWIDSMLERTRHLIQHSITGSIFLKKDCHPSFALCNTLVISWKQNLQLRVQSFTLLMGVLNIPSNLLLEK